MTSPNGGHACPVGMAKVPVLENEGSLGKGGPVFSPPLYKQRYEAVLNIARRLDPQPRKVSHIIFCPLLLTDVLCPAQVVDYGCAECKFLRLLKKEDYIEELVGVDLDSVPLTMNSNLVKPLITDYLHRRTRPLHIALMQGVTWQFQYSALYDLTETLP